MVREIARAIRLVQPEIVISRWTGQPADEHGHHQAIGELTAEAFRAAGDPDLFPSSASSAWRLGCPVGSISRSAATGRPDRTWRRWEPPGGTRAGRVVRIDAGALDPIGGQTFQEQGWSALNQHRSQGMALLPGPGRFVYYYRLIEGSVAMEPPTRARRAASSGA